MKTRGIARVRHFSISASAQQRCKGECAGSATQESHRCFGGGRSVLVAVAVCVALGPAWAQSGVPEVATEVSGERILAESGIHGGLIVQAGCRDAALAVSLAEAPNVLVQGLVRDRDRLEEVRSQIRDAGLYGRVSAMPWEGPLLPYADGMVNLLLVTDEHVELEPRGDRPRPGALWASPGFSATAS